MIIILNGPMNSGKSTVAALLVKKMPNTANLEVDELLKPIDHLENVDVEKLVFKNILSLVYDYKKYKLNVVISYVFGEYRASKLIETLKELDSNVQMFTLGPTLKTALTTRGGRKISKGEQVTIKKHYKQMIQHSKTGTVVDNSSQSPKDTTSFILTKIKK